MRKMEQAQKQVCPLRGLAVVMAVPLLATVPEFVSGNVLIGARRSGVTSELDVRCDEIRTHQSQNRHRYSKRQVRLEFHADQTPARLEFGKVNVSAARIGAVVLAMVHRQPSRSTG